MEKFEFNNFHYQLSTEFQKLDVFLEDFQTQFREEFLDLITTKFSSKISYEKLEDLLLSYANQIFNTAESVSYKDADYSEVRLKDELDSMTRVVGTFSAGNNQNGDFSGKTHQKAKEIMIQFFPDLIDLSANGFRLLEKCCQMYNREFLANFNTFVE